MNDRRACCDSENGSAISRDDVRSFYSNAALAAQESLCCPTDYNEEDLSHIPKEVREISYGCGSPVSKADLQPGDVMIDLGSGGGIDCFIAAKFVGAKGRIIGVDMTEEMLALATKNTAPVAENLGYANVEFRKGFLEAIPVEDRSVDLVTSNCVINLSVNKYGVFEEIHRILKPGGSFLIADIISEREVPQEMKNDKELWGECISGACTLAEFLTAAGKSQFKGFKFQKDYLWKEVQGIKFYSYTIAGYKFEASEDASCRKKLNAIYSGPFQSVTCEGIVFPLGSAVEIGEEDAELLRAGPYAGQFIISDPETEAPLESDSCCG